MLDRFLDKDGEDIVLRRIVGTSNQSNSDVVCRAKVTAATEQQIIGGIPATDFNLILSPTQINDAQWPGGTVPRVAVTDNDPRLPRINQDRVILKDRGGPPRTVAFVDPVIVSGVLVRINMRVSG